MWDKGVAWRKRKWGGGVFSPPPSFKRKKFSPQFGKKTREKSMEEVSLMWNYPYTFSLFINLMLLPFP